jgi:hypothetical protein
MPKTRTSLCAALITSMLVVPIGTAIAIPQAVSALSVVVVTTASDVVDAADGLTSLREAFTIANIDGDDTQITLLAGQVHRLCDGVISGTDEDANVDGDLDHTEANTLTIVGNDGEIRNGCGGERVLHSAHADGTIELQDVQVSGGDLSVGEPGSGLLSAGDATITDVTFTDNTGGVAVEVGEQFTFGTIVVVTDSTFSDNGGGIRINDGDGTVTGTDFLFNQGPAITANRSSLALSEALVRENASGINGLDGSISVSDSHVRDNSGFGVRNTGNTDSGQDLTITNTIIERNDNGGVECSFCTGLSITGSTIADNVPDGFGGSGVSFRQNLDGPTVVISSSTISGNTSIAHGGGLIVVAEDGFVADVTVSGTTITGNRAGLFGDGGGIHATSADITITDSHIDANFAKPEGIIVGGSGGGIAMRDGGSLTVTGSTIDDNFADDGGGAVTLFDVATASFTGSGLSDNVADGFGGGAFEATGDGTSYSFVDTTIEGNAAQLAGGGINIANDSPGVAVLLDGSTLSANDTALNGGGLFTNTALAAVTVRNSTVTGNTAFSIGGGLAVLTTGTVTLEHATIVDNTAPTAANLYHQTGALTSFGSVIALPQGGGDDCDTFSGPTVSQGANFSSADTCGFGAGPDDQQAGGNPMLGPLADAGGQTFVRSPLAGSPLVSVIAPADCVLSVDQVGTARPVGPGCDVGSVEIDGGIDAMDDFIAIAVGKRRWTIIHPLLNDYDPDQRLKWSSLRIIDKPDHGKAVVFTHGRVKYVADKRFVGTDSFTYRVCTRPSKRQQPACYTAVVTIKVG